MLLGGLLLPLAPLPATAQPMAPAIDQVTTPPTGQPKPPPAAQPTPVVQSASAGQESFRAHVRNDLAAWRGKMDAFETRAAASGHRAADAADAGLRAAWTRVEVAGQKVQAASARDWDGVKASYETASHDLGVAWDRIVP